MADTDKPADRTDQPASFWDHLDELRSAIIKILTAVCVFTIAAFCFKDFLFRIVLAPTHENFILYRLFRYAVPDINLEPVALINTSLAGQFFIHMRVALLMGVLLSMPYILYQLFRFVSPALYARERLYATRIVLWGYLLFMLGVALSYFIIFPLTYRFLATYQVELNVTNLISLTSYISTLNTMCLLMGLMFELPILSWLFGKLGFLTSAFMKKYRRHALVIILVIAAIITPTGDPFTLTVVTLPIYLLYEASILLVRSTERS